tara:strand:- start:10574 stop:10747 length:174 start_codon:yes stop_codon:yes gene_type:complete
VESNVRIIELDGANVLVFLWFQSVELILFSFEQENKIKKIIRIKRQYNFISLVGLLN